MTADVISALLWWRKAPSCHIALPITSAERLDEFGHVRLGGIGNTLAAEIEGAHGI